MSSYQFPGGPSVGTPEFARFLTAASGDRRAFFKRAQLNGLAREGLYSRTMETVE